MRDQLILAIPWRELIRNLIHILRGRGLSVRRTFDLQEARRSLRNAGTVPCPHHGIVRCSCQYLVLQIGRGGDSVALVVHGGDNKTEVTVLRPHDCVLVKAGFSNVSNLDGGMIAWDRAGFPIKFAEAGTEARRPDYRKDGG